MPRATEIERVTRRGRRVKFAGQAERSHAARAIANRNGTRSPSLSANDSSLVPAVRSDFLWSSKQKVPLATC